MNYNSETIDYKMGYLYGCLKYISSGDFDDFISEANNLILDMGIPLDIHIAELICDNFRRLAFSSFRGISIKYEQRMYIVIDEEQAVYIKDNLIVIEDDKELVEKLNELLDGEDYAFECAECSKKVIRDSEEHDNSGTIDDTDWFCCECFSTKNLEEEDMDC